MTFFLLKRPIIGYSVFAILFMAFVQGSIIVLAGLPVAELPRQIPENATIATVLTTVTQQNEISKVSALVLTAEGILLGLSPILFDRIPRKSVGALTITITAIGLIVSLITVASADTVPVRDFTQVYRTYFIGLSLFGMVVGLYVLGSWLVVLEKSSLKRTVTTARGP